jgi:hypothetical protein
MREILGDKLFFSWFFKFEMQDNSNYENNIINNCTDPSYFPLEEGDIKNIDIGYNTQTYTVTVGYGANGYQQIIFTKNKILFLAPPKSIITQKEESLDMYINWSPKKLRPCNSCELGETVTRVNYDKVKNAFVPVEEEEFIRLESK